MVVIDSLSDLLQNFGHYPPERIRMRPSPGSATENDVLTVEQKEGKLCELIDGVLVEKAMEFRESLVAAEVTTQLKNHVKLKKLGIVTSADGTVMLYPRQIRIPDCAFYAWSDLPGGKAPTEAIPEIYPTLAVEVLSEGNTRPEMERKLKDYFFAGTKLVWFIDPDTRTAQIFTAPDQLVTLKETDTLDGGSVLPGFQLPLADLFRDAGV